ncbi:regulating synaptic membrane exocytosis protein 2 isoform X2 [Amyelois transitella]|uniref:regulating synaptic membrane exocytosis protein 2 isoform X2 n=1 Tax=Amyelois transitella TaxID=680683 RepID=UPI0029905014|nr:regulating synaptic membrane exocytosis protein 2 isoform X2 [Amyelois transitella]
MADMPDLSHLTPEERAIIENVMLRQRQEEQREHEIMRRKQDEVAVLEQTIRTRNEMQRAAGVELAATCHICLKTKFADGVGHSCHYCRVRCCARCGGKVTLRSNKVIWVCILCRKKQELLSKTGQWIHKGAGQDSMLWRMEADMRGFPTQPDSSLDKRPKLERAHSAAEKENLPLQRSSSALRRQYSQQETSRCYGELEGLARTHPHLVHPRQKAAYGVDDNIPQAPSSQLMPHVQSHPPLPPRSSSSDDEVVECVSDENDECRDRGQLEACGSRHPHLRSASVAVNNYYNLTNHSPSTYESDARSAFESGRPAGSGRSFDSVTDCRWRARDDGEGAYLRPYAPDEGPRPDRAVYKSAYLWEDSSDNRRFTERRKKTVRFDGHEGAATFPRGGRDASAAPQDWASLRWESERQTSQDSATKDSGIDTSSTFTSSEDSNRGDCPKFPQSWQVSADGTRMVGHMVLRKSVVEGSSHSSAAILGLKVVGGKLMPDGSRCAVVEKVKKGSIADLEGQLRIGDEVLQWNGKALQGRSADEVAEVVADSKHDSHVELVVSRPITASRAPAQPWRNHKEVYTEVMGGCEKPSVLVTSPGSPDVHARRRPGRYNHHNANVAGRIQLKVYFDISALQLLVTVVSANGLTPRSDGSPRCPYCKIFLLPDKSEKSKRRTKTLANTLEPRWNQTFVYCGIRITDIKKRVLEVTVWDLNRYGPNDFLGEVLLELDNIVMNHEPNWYTLRPHEESVSFSRYREDEADGEHLSPPSTSTSRLSDSDTPSECDLRRHHSLSSLGSSSSPPPTQDRMDMDGTRNSRRDVSPAGRVRAAGLSRERSGGYSVARSQSAAGVARPARARSKSPRRSLSPPADAAGWRYTGAHPAPRRPTPPDPEVNEERGGDGSRLPTHAYAPRFQSRSATATPTTSPKKRQLPQIPHHQGAQRAVRAQVSADLEERKWIAPHHIGATLTYRSTPQGQYTPTSSKAIGWERHYAGLSDSELAARGGGGGGGGWAPRRRLSPDAAAADSDLESVGSVTSSAFSTQSERPRPTRMLSNDYNGRENGRGNNQSQPLERRESRRGQFTRSLSNADVPPDEKADGSLSDTALGGAGELEPTSDDVLLKAEPRDYFGPGMGKKSNSTSQLSATVRRVEGETTRRKRSGPATTTFQRSHEVCTTSLVSISSSEGSSWSPGMRGSGSSDGGGLSDFIDGLGPGQLVGRQLLGAPTLGDVQLSMCYQKGFLEVEVIRARGLQARQGSRTLPAPYVKVYLVNGKRCVAKAKTSTARRTLDPLYQQTLTFRENYKGCVLQVTVWGDYGRIEGKKVFMGVAQIMLDDLNLSNIVIGWYKLFGTTSL